MVAPAVLEDRLSKSHDDLFGTLGGLAPLPKSEMLALVAAAKTDRDALDRLVRCNMKLVLRLAKGDEDAALVGAAAIVSAVKTFNPDKGAWSSHANRWIKDAIQRHREQDRTIQIPEFMQDRINALNRIERSMMDAADGERPVSDAVLMAANVPAKEGAAGAPTMGAWRSGAVLSMSQERGRGDSDLDSRLDVEAPVQRDDDDEDEKRDDPRLAVLARLTGDQREAVRMLAGIGEERPLSLREVAERLGKTLETVRKLVKRAASNATAEVA